MLGCDPKNVECLFNSLHGMRLFFARRVPFFAILSTVSTVTLHFVVVVAFHQCMICSVVFIVVVVVSLHSAGLAFNVLSGLAFNVLSAGLAFNVFLLL